MDVRHPDYPIVALQQLVRNAIMHRDYETSNAPVRITWFNDRIEIQNPGGPFGQVTCENFGTAGSPITAILTWPKRCETLDMCNGSAWGFN